MEPITDPKQVDEGVLLPIGGHKGSGLALMIGLLAGVLNGAAFGRDVVDPSAPGNAATNTGQFVIALDVARFLPLDAFTAEINGHVHDLASSKKLPGVDEIRIPGQGRAARRSDRLENGVPLSGTLLKQVDEVAKSLAIEPLTSR